MQLIDTHTHLYLPEFDHDRDEMVKRAVSSGISRLLMPDIDKNSSDLMLKAAEEYQGICIPMAGLHPTSVKEDYMEELDRIDRLFTAFRFIAVGETGIDLFWDKTFLKEQKESLRRHILWALKEELPLVIHSRDSFPEIFSVLEEFKDKKLSGVFHAFSGTVADAENAVSMGFMLGIGGPLTFKNSKLPDVVKHIGIGHIVLETDSPYLAPVPYRGKRNESSYLRIINKKLAEVLDTEEELTASATFDNSCRLFNIS